MKFIKYLIIIFLSIAFVLECIPGSVVFETNQLNYFSAVLINNGQYIYLVNVLLTIALVVAIFVYCFNNAEILRLISLITVAVLVILELVTFLLGGFVINTEFFYSIAILILYCGCFGILSYLKPKKDNSND